MTTQNSSCRAEQNDFLSFSFQTVTANRKFFDVVWLNHNPHTMKRSANWNRRCQVQQTFRVAVVGTLFFTCGHSFSCQLTTARGSVVTSTSHSVLSCREKLDTNRPKTFNATDAAPVRKDPKLLRWGIWETVRRLKIAFHRTLTKDHLSTGAQASPALCVLRNRGKECPELTVEPEHYATQARSQSAKAKFHLFAVGHSLRNMLPQG